MRALLLILTFCLLSGIVYAQPSDKKISRITFDMVDGHYEKAIKRADKLVRTPEYRKNGWLHFYLTQSYFEVSKMDELEDKYPKAFKEALKSAYKLTRFKDVDGENARAYMEASDVLNQLKDSTITLSEIYYDNENPRLAALYLRNVMRFDPENYAVQLMQGVYEIKSRNIGAGIKNIMASMEGIEEDYTPDGVSAQTLVDALEEYALIIESGEYDKFFKAYKFNPTQSDVDNALAMREEYKKYLMKPERSKAERKQESEIIYKSFKSSEGDEDDENDDDID